MSYANRKVQIAPGLDVGFDKDGRSVFMAAPIEGFPAPTPGDVAQAVHVAREGLLRHVAFLTAWIEVSTAPAPSERPSIILAPAGALPPTNGSGRR